MIKLAFLLFFTSAFSKITKPSYQYILFEQFNSVYEYPTLAKPLPAVSAWVLSLNKDVDSLKLRVATSEEAREVFGTKLDNGPNHRQPRTDKEPRKLTEPSSDVTRDETKRGAEKALLAEIMRVINKFILTVHSEPDSYVGEDTGMGFPILKLYFKGPHTSLVVRAGGRQWHYIIGPPSLFPNWFYQAHELERDDQGAFVIVPQDVAIEFYKALLHMLTMFLSFPL